MSKLLDPKVMMAIKDLNLSAKTTIDGFMSGINKSTIKGPGLEFSQYRSYQPGDDLRSLDWKMFARSDRYYIRESEVETNIAVRFLVDASASMNHHDGEFTKIDYARYLTACLAYLANLQGDAIGLYIFKNTELFSMVAKQDYQHLARLFFQLEQLKPEGEFTKPIHYKEIFSGTQNRELLVFVTDLYQTAEEIFDLLDTLNALGHEILVFHVLSRNEIELDFKGYSTFEDLETGQTLQIDQTKARSTYQTKLRNYLDKTRNHMLDRRIYYRTITTDEPLDQALRDFLKQRNKLKV
ncbi:DUF58 domain-containing protein [Pedobacter insulae]|uniref:DUF58 domain-containing protein n=1 Tax=Pedobacter insulae TaxID=414048 RepID=A0A1I2Y2U9_9SPHI|nr:DUF58 domain-containing protein [Pedobacter insulae]SFH19276.1 Protein of unknown function DUF58 [Pedobacter insulae]